jgi:hypothetical protein
VVVACHDDAELAGVQLGVAEAGALVGFEGDTDVGRSAVEGLEDLVTPEQLCLNRNGRVGSLELLDEVGQEIAPGGWGVDDPEHARHRDPGSSGRGERALE